MTAALIEFEPNLRFKSLTFPDLETRFKKHLGQARSIKDLDHLIESISPIFQEQRYSSEELLRLKKLRQKAYDRKRISKFQTSRAAPDTKIQLPKLAKNLGPDPQITGLSPPTKSCFQKTEGIMNIEAVRPSQKNESFIEGAHRALSSINGEQFVKTIPKAIAWFGAAILVTFFLWQQSLALYGSSWFYQFDLFSSWRNTDDHRLCRLPFNYSFMALPVLLPLCGCL